MNAGNVVEQLGAVLELTGAARMMVAPTRLLPASKDELKSAIRTCYRAQVAAGSLSKESQDTLELGYVSLAHFLDDEDLANHINEAFRQSEAGGIAGDFALRRHRATLADADRLREEFRAFTSECVTTPHRQPTLETSPSSPGASSTYKYYGYASIALSSLAAFLAIASFFDGSDLARSASTVIAACIEAGFGYAVVIGHKYTREYWYAVISCFWFGLLTPIGVLLLIVNLLAVRAVRASQPPGAFAVQPSS